MSRDGDTVNILVAPQECPYDNDRRQILFDVGAAQQAGCAVTVEQLADLHTGIVTCHGCIYHQGLLHQSFLKQMLEVVELPHPDDLAFHALAGIDLPLIHQAILMFLVQLWQKGDLVRVVAGEFADTTG